MTAIPPCKVRYNNILELFQLKNWKIWSKMEVKRTNHFISSCLKNMSILGDIIFTSKLRSLEFL